MDSILCLESLNTNLIQIENEIKDSRQRLIESLTNNHHNINSSQFNKYLQLVQNLYTETDKFNKLLTDSTNSTMDIADDSENYITDLEDNANEEVETKSNELAMHCSINDSSSYTLKFNGSLRSPQIPKYSIGESVTSTFSSDMLASSAEQDDNHPLAIEEEEEEKYSQPLQKHTNHTKSDRSNASDRSYHRMYKYGGTGFEVWKGRALYTSTQILCKTSIHHNDKPKLIQSMISDGHFRSNMIESIDFKIETRRHSNYAVIQVRGSLSVIQNNIKAFNESHGNDGMIILARKKLYKKQSTSNRTIIVTGFDIKNENVHKHFTELFVKYGDLAKDISMGLDHNKDPFAIVTFVNIADAKNCYEHGNLIFNGRNLNIQYSKFQFIRNYF